MKMKSLVGQFEITFTHNYHFCGSIAANVNVNSELFYKNIYNNLGNLKILRMVFSHIKTVFQSGQATIQYKKLKQKGDFEIKRNLSSISLRLLPMRTQSLSNITMLWDVFPLQRIAIAKQKRTFIPFYLSIELVLYSEFLHFVLIKDNSETETNIHLVLSLHKHPTKECAKLSCNFFAIKL